MKNWIIAVSIISGAIICSLWFIITRNKIVNLREDVNMQWAQIENLIEEYYELQVSEYYTNLEDELSGYQSMISLAKEQYIEKLNAYNDAIQFWPNSFVADLCGFDKMDYHKIDAKSLEVPVINMD